MNRLPKNCAIDSCVRPLEGACTFPPGRGVRPSRAAFLGLAILSAIELAAKSFAGVDVPELQQRILRGQAEDARRTLSRAVKDDPKNVRLLYDRAVAAYAAGKFDEALVDLDLVEDSKNRDLAQKAKFQKGNAQFHLGATTLDKDTEATLSRWRQSVTEYSELLKTQPSYTEARNNHDFVRRRLRELLLKTALKNFQSAAQPQSLADERIASARASMEEFHEASSMETADKAASQGEEQAKDLLANLLAQEGERRTMSQNLVMPGKNEPPVARLDTGKIQQGVEMLEDAQSLKPNDASISEKLERGRDRLADALTTQAQTYQRIEPRIPKVEEKLGILRMAMELLDKALADRPNHERAKQTLEEVKRRLAEVHEQEADRLEDQSQFAQLEQQAQELSEALEHYQQASELQPQQKQLPSKAQRTQSELEQALEKLGDQLMKSPGLETLEQEVMRMEGASQAFNELESLKPSPRTSEKAKKAGDALDRLRKMLAERGKSMPQPGGAQQSPAPMPPQDNADGTPMDAPPKLDTKGKNGRYQSPAMNRNLRDY